MSIYRFFTIDHDKQIQGPAVAHKLSSDAEAVVMGSAILAGLPETSAVEVWHGARLVKRVTRAGP